MTHATELCEGDQLLRLFKGRITDVDYAFGRALVTDNLDVWVFNMSAWEGAEPPAVGDIVEVTVAVRVKKVFGPVLAAKLAK